MTHIPDSCYYLIIIVILSFSQVKMYVFIHTIIMTDIAKLQILIKQEEERGDELEQKITHEMRLLEEAEHQKLIIMRQILEQRLNELRKDNMMKEQKLLDIWKWKESTFREVHELEKQFAARVSYLVLHHIFSRIF